MRRASATGLLDNLGGEGQPLPESHGRDSSMGQAAIQQLRRVARRGPGTQHPGARLSPFSPRPDPRQDYSTPCEYALQRYTAPCSAPPCAQATRAGLDCGEVRGCAQREAVSIMAARVSGRNLCYAEAVRIVGRNVDKWIVRTQAATPYGSEERVVAGTL